MTRSVTPTLGRGLARCTGIQRGHPQIPQITQIHGSDRADVRDRKPECRASDTVKMNHRLTQMGGQMARTKQKSESVGEWARNRVVKGSSGEHDKGAKARCEEA